MDGAPELVVLRHAACGAMALVASATLVDNPGRAVMARDLLYMDGSEPKAGEQLRCKSCGAPFRFGPPDLCLDHGPDHRQSRVQRMALKLTDAILTGYQA